MGRWNDRILTCFCYKSIDLLETDHKHDALPTCIIELLIRSYRVYSLHFYYDCFLYGFKNFVFVLWHFLVVVVLDIFIIQLSSFTDGAVLIAKIFYEIDFYFLSFYFYLNCCAYENKIQLFLIISGFFLSNIFFPISGHLYYPGK